MPRDGSNVYHYPVGIEGEPNQTIESASYNSLLSDVEQDLNVPRPIIAGGTGATSAEGALAALSGEQAGQIVTNYDSHTFKAGSFYSAPGATAAPTASNYFVGICYMMDANAIVLEARLFTGALPVAPYVKYIRIKSAAGWSVWSQQTGSIADTVATADALYVNLTGDIMTGDLAIDKSNPGLVLNKAVSGQTNTIYGKRVNFNRWSMRLGNDTAESGSNSGSDFDILRFADGGAFLSTALNINRASGGAVFGASLYATGIVTSSPTTTTGTYYFGNSGTKFLTYDGTRFEFSGGQAWGNFVAAATYPTAGLVVRDIGSNVNKPIRVNTSGSLEFLNNASSSVIMSLTDGGTLAAILITSSTGYSVKAGTLAAPGGNLFNINHGTGQQLWIDSTNMGTFAYTSDYRTKKDTVDLSGTWDAVKALRPIKYTHKDFTPPVEQEACAERGEPFMKGDNIERWGFIAHELQKTLVESASSGVKDSPDTIQSPNPWTVIAALTKALQEAMARIEALEVR